ncbi:MAG: hypothetical protein JOZ92_08300 [Candidatus Dormibacteraeota bacterium]|nr:hypothetical protein [Candidatus Dormibacteraeota bacterium]
MRTAAAATLAALALSGARLAPLPAGASSTPAHVLVIVEENRSAGEVLGSAQAPYLTSLANTYGLAQNAYGQSHPSLPNYLELISGSTQGVSDDGTGYVFSAPTLAGQLSAAGIGWRAYMEGVPSACYHGVSGNGYAKKHDPFMYFAQILDNPAQCDNVVPYAQLSTDLGDGTAPPFLWITPNLCDDGHDCSTATMDAWLGAQLPVVLRSSWFADHGVVIITWDEGVESSGCCSGAHGGHIATIVIAHDVVQHRVITTRVDHGGTLRTIETLYGLPYLGDAACTCSGDLLGLTTPPPRPAWTWLTVPRFR